MSNILSAFQHSNHLCGTMPQLNLCTCFLVGKPRKRTAKELLGCFVVVAKHSQRSLWMRRFDLEAVHQMIWCKHGLLMKTVFPCTLVDWVNKYWKQWQLLFAAATRGIQWSNLAMRSTWGKHKVKVAGTLPGVRFGTNNFCGECQMSDVDCLVIVVLRQCQILLCFCVCGAEIVPRPSRVCVRCRPRMIAKHFRCERSLS